MFYRNFNELSGDQQLLMIDIVGNPVFRAMIKTLMDEAQQDILDLSADGESPEDFRLAYAVAQNTYINLKEIYDDIEVIRLELEQRMQ